MKNKNTQAGIQCQNLLTGPVASQLLVGLRNFVVELLCSGRLTLEEANILRATLRLLEEGILDLLYPEKE